MSLVPSLLQAIVHVNGEAMVMHAGDKPYVVAPSGQIELAGQGLSLDAVDGIVNQMLPPEFRHALDEFGAVQYDLPPQPEFPHERFTIVAARGGDDLWAEIRRRTVPDEDAVPEEFFALPSAGDVRPAGALRQDAIVDPHASVEVPAVYASGATDDDTVDLDDIEPVPSVEVPAVYARKTVDDDDTFDLDSFEPASSVSARALPADEHEDLLLPDEGQLWPDRLPRGVSDDGDGEQEISLNTDDDLSFDEVEAPPPPVPPVHVAPPAPPPAPPVHVAPPAPPPAPPVHVAPPAPPPAPPVHVAPPAPPPAPPVHVAPPAPPPAPPVHVAPPAPPPAPPVHVAPPAPPPAPPVYVAPPVRPTPPPMTAAPMAVVLPMSRSPIRGDVPPPLPPGDTLSGLERLLRTAAARGAGTLYLSSDARPSVRVDGQLQILDSEPVHTSNDVVSLLLTLMPDRSHEALRTGATTEWICDIEDIGRVRCMSFADHRGPGGVFRLMPVRAVSADQLSLPREVQALAIEPEGLVLVAGLRSSGKRTLMSALVDLIGHTRRDHVITIEREVNIVHSGGNSFISQREVRGGDDDVLAAARAALREDPDVLVLEQIRTGALMNVALEAAASGHLVIGGFSAHNATEAIDRIIDLYAPENGRQVQLALADNLRGVVAQVLLSKTTGGRVAAREVLLNTPAVAGVIAEGKTSHLPMAIEGGRRHGMVPMQDGLVALVQSGTVDVREAYRYVTDRPAFLALLRRQGIDTSPVEQHA